MSATPEHGGLSEAPMSVRLTDAEQDLIENAWIVSPKDGPAGDDDPMYRAVERIIAGRLAAHTPAAAEAEPPWAHSTCAASCTAPSGCLNPRCPNRAADREGSESASADCPDHHEVQHRDRKPPWCNACGWNRGRPAIPPRQVGKPR